MYNLQIASIVPSGEISRRLPYGDGHTLTGQTSDESNVRAPTDTRPIVASVKYYVPSNKTVVQACEHHIPAVIIPVLWEGDLLQRHIWSIDVPVKKIIVIVNRLELSAGYEAENNAFNQLRNVTEYLENEIPTSFIDVFYLDENLGFSRSLNLGMRIVSGWAPWWLCANADIGYTPGALMSVIPLVWKDHASGTLLYMLGQGFSAIIFTTHLISKVGLFDEHIWPAYVEDCDLMLRVRMAVGDVNINDHEGGEQGKYYYLQPEPALQHVGGQGSSSSFEYKFAARVQQAHRNNIAYYLTKWGISSTHWDSGAGFYKHGCGILAEGQFSKPFNVSTTEWEALPYVLDHDKKQNELFA